MTGRWIKSAVVIIGVTLAVIAGLYYTLNAMIVKGRIGADGVQAVHGLMHIVAWVGAGFLIMSTRKHSRNGSSNSDQ